MGGRAEILAARFRAMNDGVMRFAAGCPEADWRRTVPHEGRSVAYLIDHIAFGYRLERRAVLASASGEEGRPPAWDELPAIYTKEDLAANNAARWEAQPYPNREETIARLRDEGERTARAIAALSEAELERPVRYAWLPEMPLAQFLERVMIHHAEMHLPGIERELATGGGADMPPDERMGVSDNPWDRLSDYFDTSKEEGEIPAGAADNILIAWPVFFRFIAAHVPALHGKRALDYGCGAGSFAHRLRAHGCHVTGIDPSRAMIAKAARAYGDTVDFRVGDSALLREMPPFSLITSIMALQFVADIEPLLTAFAAALDTSGRLIFAVHNPAFFSGETLRFSNGVAMPIFIRSAAEYHAAAARAGFEPLLEEYPPFTEEFIARYPTYARQPAPEYLILGYRTGGAS